LDKVCTQHVSSFAHDDAVVVDEKTTGDNVMKKDDHHNDLQR
jgi:hypothetical protein